METYYGRVQTPGDAIKLFEACRIGMLPRVQRRLSEKERQGIRSGSVFVWDEKEAGMRRWTDGKSWSASRVSGSFLTYREMEGKRGNVNGQGPKRSTGKTPDSGRGSEEDLDDTEPDGYRYKPDGLMKQSFSITTSAGQHLHLISYFARGAAGNDLPTPSNDSQFRAVGTPAKGLYPESSLQDTQIPLNTKEPMQHPPLVIQATITPATITQAILTQVINIQAILFQATNLIQATRPIQPSHQPMGWSPPPPDGAPQYSHTYYGPPPHLPPPQHHYPSHAPPTHQQPPYEVRRPPQYNRMMLPLPEPSGHSGARTLAPIRAPHTPPEHQPTLPLPPPPLPRSPHMDQPPRIPPIDSPRSQQLQAQAREAAARIDPRPGLGSQQGPLPSLSFPSAASQYPAGQYGAAPSQTPPTRPLSLSPRSTHSDTRTTQPPPSASNKASLSVLLHPTPANSEPSSASATGSPAALEAASNKLPPLSDRLQDHRALGMLDKNY
ncbi:Gti1/Pac2 family-domain-containing protein [Podospora conica]|nr:Gti1/Pac2 family-domain-containing protein [Schizothecium conicum]